jgi:rare lipoprotein A
MILPGHRGDHRPPFGFAVALAAAGLLTVAALPAAAQDDPDPAPSSAPTFGFASSGAMGLGAGLGAILATRPPEAAEPDPVEPDGAAPPSEAALTDAPAAVVVAPPSPAPPAVAPGQGWAATVTRVAPAVPAPGPATPRPRAQAGPHELLGAASYYWQSTRTASGEAFDRDGLTAAHRTLPMNTRVRVTNIANGRSVVVRINDRGPFKPGRVIDLSLGAARTIGMERQGVAPVKVEVLGAT